MAASAPLDIIVTDTDMPVMDGAVFIQRSVARMSIERCTYMPPGLSVSPGSGRIVGSRRRVSHAST
jgi:hypothetical protein